MIKLVIKPLSVNQAWQGKRFKTKAYKSYEEAVLVMLPKSYEVPSGELRLTLEVGFSNKSSDLDNSFKQFIDCLQKKYGFNDSKIYEIHAKKVIVKKGSEFISFSLSKLGSDYEC